LISVVNEDIFVKFGTLTDIGHVSVTVAQYPTFGKIQDGGCRDLGFVFLQHIAVTIGDVSKIWYADRHWPYEGH